VVVVVAALPSVPGTRPSVHNGQLLASTGLHDLDGTSRLFMAPHFTAHHMLVAEVLGGGVGVGTLLLIEEDVRTTHARTLLKYFAAEGLACTHNVLSLLQLVRLPSKLYVSQRSQVVLASGDPSALALADTLPSRVEALPIEDDAEKVLMFPLLLSSLSRSRSSICQTATRRRPQDRLAVSEVLEGR
jgi:hypothetical protein